VSVVPAEVAGERFGAVVACGVGEAVGPFAQQCLDGCFGFAVGLWPAGSGVAAADLEFLAGGCPGVGAVAVAVVGEDALDLDAVVAVEADGAVEEGDAVGGTFAWPELGVGERGVVVGPPPLPWTAGG
jgi:hypothetical protein